ncbi:hypothetical protein [Comamonas terrigena]|uniref:hypothetical protein n=1 Tax=Comamonas terrigena TaxID=32013 RepID=UPI0028B06A82|nr:hypothetical protein [Comamonas terrigena]
MKRENIRLRSLARSGDIDARMKLGGFYLEGTMDFPRNIKIALEYLSTPALKYKNETAKLICEHLDILEIIEHHQIENLRIAAVTDKLSRIKLITLLIVRGEHDELIYWTEKKDLVFCVNIKKHLSNIYPGDYRQVLAYISTTYDIPTLSVVAAEAKSALVDGYYRRAEDIISLASSNTTSIPSSIYEIVTKIVTIAEENRQSIGKIPISLIEDSLEYSASANNKNSCYLLGRILAGLKTECIDSSNLSISLNLRKSIALLLKAADSGRSEAWLDLFYLCSDYRSSVGNPSMARFCLEKASFFGIAEAKRRLGVITLKDARSIEQMEMGLSLLYESSINGDSIAASIIKTLVFDVQGTENEADSGIAEVQQVSPLLATRLRIARYFGLTKLEALSINPATAIRPWGLVVDRNPYIKKGSLAEPRAVPAASRKAIECIRNAAMEFAPNGEIAELLEGSLRARSLKQRRLFQKINLQEHLFFSQANSSQRYSIRIGTRWAQNQKNFLNQVMS